MQYSLNMSTYAGRLDLEGPVLDNYGNALIRDWEEQACDPRFLWSDDHGEPDISISHVASHSL